MSIAAPPEASRSMTHFRCKKDFFYKIQYRVVEQRACIHSLYDYNWLNRSDEQNAKSDILEQCYLQCYASLLLY